MKRSFAAVLLIVCLHGAVGEAAERYDVRLYPAAGVPMKDVPYAAFAHQWHIQNDRLMADTTISFEATYTAERDADGNVTLATWKVSKCVRRIARDGNKETQLVAPGGVIERRVQGFPERLSEEFLVDGKPPDDALAAALHSIVGTGEAGSYSRAGAAGSRAVGDEWRLDSAIVTTEFSRNPKSPLVALPEDIKVTAKLLAALPVDGVPSLAVLTDSHIAKLAGRPGTLPPSIRITDAVAWQKNLFIIPADVKSAAGVRAEVTDGSVAFGLSNNSTRRFRVHLARTIYAAADHSDSLIKAIESLGQSFESRSRTDRLPGTFVRNAETVGTTTTTMLTFEKDGGYQRDTGDASNKKTAGRWTFEAGVLKLQDGRTTTKLPLLFCDEDGLLLGKVETAADGGDAGLPDECFYRREIQKK